MWWCGFLKSFWYNWEDGKDKRILKFDRKNLFWWVWRSKLKKDRGKVFSGSVNFLYWF